MRLAVSDAQPESAKPAIAAIPICQVQFIACG
jgi:hypothetical protein